MARPTPLSRTLLAHTVRQLRQSVGETQEQFARRLDASVVTIARYETNFRPRKSMLRRLADLARDRGLADMTAVFEFELGDERKADLVMDRLVRFVLVKEIERLPKVDVAGASAALALLLAQENKLVFGAVAVLLDRYITKAYGRLQASVDAVEQTAKQDFRDHETNAEEELLFSEGETS